MKQYKDSNLWITEDGRVYNKKFDRWLKGYLMNGYRVISLSPSEGDKETEFLHRMVGLCYIPNPDNKPWINHKNGIKDDNRVDNLEWCTPLENTIHARNMKLLSTGSNRYNSLFNVSDIKDILFHYKNGCSASYLANKYKCDTSLINNILNGRSYKDEVGLVGIGEIKRDVNISQSSYVRSGYKIGSEWHATTVGGEDITIRFDSVSEYGYEIWRWFTEKDSGWSISYYNCKKAAPKICGKWKRVKNETYDKKNKDRHTELFNSLEWGVDFFGYVVKEIDYKCFGAEDKSSKEVIYFCNVVRRLGMFKILHRNKIRIYKLNENGEKIRE